LGNRFGGVILSVYWDGRRVGVGGRRVEGVSEEGESEEGKSDEGESEEWVCEEVD